MRAESSQDSCRQRGGMRSDCGGMDATEDFGSAQPHFMFLVNCALSNGDRAKSQPSALLFANILFASTGIRASSTPVDWLCLCRDSPQLRPSKLSHHYFLLKNPPPQLRHRTLLSPNTRDAIPPVTFPSFKPPIICCIIVRDDPHAPCYLKDHPTHHFTALVASPAICRFRQDVSSQRTLVKQLATRVHQP